MTYNIGGPVWVPGKLRRCAIRSSFSGTRSSCLKNVTGALQYSPCPRLCSGPAISGNVVGGKLVPVTDPNTGVAFPGNLMPVSRIDTNGLALLNVFPLPNASTRPTYNYVNKSSTKRPVQLAT